MEEQSEVRKQYAETVPYLLHWYGYNRRILPWREDPTPYHVWVSEIMLQQTRVEAVKGYYDRFLACLPNVKALATAEEETLLKLWEGLGYYNRVRNMQKAAEILTEQYDGEMPADYEAIRALPGIGDYTAGAIASIAFGLPYPAVDGNVLRVMSRITGSTADIAKESTKQAMKQDLLAVMPKESGDFNQALMELGATVCIPNGKPLCEQCPVIHLCKAFHEGRETELPVKSGKKERRVEHRLVYLVFCGDKVLLHRRPKKGLLAGLWEFPNVLAEGNKQSVTKKRLTEITEELRGVLQPGTKVTVQKGKKAKHIFSHVEWHMEGITIETEGTPAAEERLTAAAYRLMKMGAEVLPKWVTDPSDWVLVTSQELRETYPLPSAFEVYRNEVLKTEEQEEAE